MEFNTKKIRELRQLRGLSQTELAEVSGIDQRQLSRYETGKNIPIPRTQRRLAKAFCVDIRIFFEQ
jgi:transcriptional regulator with XRE-family HTH domain